MTVIYVYNAREHVGIIQSTARFLDWQLNFDKGASVYSDESWWLEMRSLQIVSMLRPLWWGNLPVRPRKVSPDTHAWPNRSVIKPVLRTALFFSLTKISLRIWRRVTSHCGASRCPALPMCVCVCVWLGLSEFRLLRYAGYCWGGRRKSELMRISSCCCCCWALYVISPRRSATDTRRSNYLLLRSAVDCTSLNCGNLARIRTRIRTRQDEPLCFRVHSPERYEWNSKHLFWDEIRSLNRENIYTSTSLLLTYVCC